MRDINTTMRVTELAKLVGTFQRHHPLITIELHDDTWENLRDRLEQGDIDVALTILGHHDDAQTSTPLFRQPLLLAVPQSHPLAQRASIRLDFQCTIGIK
jgi:DNA-binding transcriptional LysR family regulator